MSSEDFQVIFDCPKCEKRLAVSEDKEGKTIYCPHCVQQIHVPGEMSGEDKLLAGLLDDEEPDHPGSLKIDGISGEAEDGVSWHIKCHICDSVLLVTKAQVGSQVKCNDCFSMLDVKPNRNIADLDTNNLNESVVNEESVPTVIAAAEGSNDDDDSSDSDELTLLPPVDLPPEVKSAQQETLLDDVIEDALVELTEEPEEVVDDIEEIPDEPLVLMDPVSIEKPPIEEVFDLQADDDDESDLLDAGTDDSDEEIEIIDVAPEVANQQLSQSQNVSSSSKTLPRIPRTGKQQPREIPVGDGIDAPIRVHAKKNRKKKRQSEGQAPSVDQRYDFESAELSGILDKAMGILGTGKIWIWALGCILLMSIGSGVWHSYAVNIGALQEVGEESFKNDLYYWAMGSLFGRSFFFLGYLLLLYVGGVIFRETALGKVKVESVMVSDRSSFLNTFLLFGFSMLVAGVAMAYMWKPYIVLPTHLLLAGLFLLPAWKNQSPFMIVSGDIGDSFKVSASWKNWFAVTGIAAMGCLFGGALLELSWPIISFFTSIIGSFVIVVSVLLYAAGSGWHCGGTVERMQQGR